MKTLESILQELVTYCATNSKKEVNIKLELPKLVYEQLTTQWTPIEKTSVLSPQKISAMYLNGGTVEFLN